MWAIFHQRGGVDFIGTAQTLRGVYMGIPIRTSESESELALAVLNVLAQMPSGQAAYEELRSVIPYYVKLTEHDCLPSLTRDGEALWEQR